jgi:calcium-translocating P-type ATPase
VLFIAATLTLVIGFFSEKDNAWVEGASIYFACAFIALFASSCDYMKEKQYLKLHDEIRNEEVNVIRGQYGLSQPCKVHNLVVGDVIHVEAGMRIPADCVLVDGMDITVDESMYNEDRESIVPKGISKGEDHHRENPDPFLLARTLVMTGSGKAVVCAVGSNTRYSQTFPVEDLKDDDELTPLQERLEKLAGFLGKWGYISGFVIFAALLLFLVCKVLFSGAELLSNDTLMSILRIFTTAVSVVIVAIPEGLPLAVSISMAFSVDTMKKDNLLVKKVGACENLGYIKEICTGKTATLTKNDMSVTHFFTGYKTVEHYERALFNLNKNVSDIITNSIILNTESRVEMSEDAKYVPEGNGTEVAMLKFLQDNDIAVQDLLTQKTREAEHECSIPFGPIRKRMTTVYRPYNGCNYVRIVVKGAPEYVLKFCNKILTSDGDEAVLDEHERTRILEDEVIGHFAKNGLRTIVYAYKDIDSDHWEDL